MVRKSRSSQTMPFSSEDWSEESRQVNGPLIFATTAQDVSSPRVGDSVTVSGKISEVSLLKYVTLQEAVVRCEHVL